MIYVFLASGFEEVEAIATVDVLRRAELEVMTVGVGGKEIKGSHGITITADIADSEAGTHNLEAIVLPGGMPGTLNLEKSENVRKFIDYCDKNGKLVCAICAAPSILGHMGLLEGKKAVCFPGFECELNAASVSDKPVCRDGRYITAKGPGVTIDFALEIAKEFVGDKKAVEIKRGMQCL